MLNRTKGSTTMSDTSHSDDTAAASTADEPDTAIVASDTSAMERRELAWSLDDGSDEPQRQPWRNTWGIVGAIAACSAVLAGTVGVTVWGLWSHHNAPAVQPSTTTTAPPPTAVAPPPTAIATPPPTVTITATPPSTTALLTTITSEAAPTHQPLIFTAAEDQAFLRDQQAHGLTIQNPAMVLHTAHDFCRMLAAGESVDQATENLIAGGLEASVAPFLTSSAMLIYPGCY
jgi:Protein of unknown function (DUF732)